MKESIQNNLIRLIKKSQSALGLDNFKEEICLDVPQDSRFGDLSSNLALRLAKKAKAKSADIASQIVARIKKDLKTSTVADYVKEVTAEGAGFINFHLSDRYFYEELKNILVKEQDALRQNIGKKENVLIEFVSANPTGSLSVAHARQATVGDVLAGILEFLGFKVSREYYLNDEGNQISILGDSVRLRIKELEGERIDFPPNYYQGDYIYDIARKAQNENLTPKKDLGEYAAKYILEIIKKELDDFGTEFNVWYSQKSLRESKKIEQAIDFFKKKSFVYEKEGALWFKSTEFGDDKDRVIIKSDGAYTYLAPDIAYHQGKYERGFKWLVNLWGPDHHGYINRLKAACQALGHAPDSLSIVIVQLVTIFREGKPVQMSTRRGAYITLREVLDEVGKDASRFFFLMRRTSSHLDFDLETAKKQTPENPVYYVQYAHARICSILRNSQVEINAKTLNLSLLKEKEEMALIKKILQLQDVLIICYKTLDPYALTVYLQELAEAFHKFYDLHRVLGQEEALTQARLVLIEAARTVLATGLELMGISRPESM
jgi:arginyl-tRNA synthetase